MNDVSLGSSVHSQESWLKRYYFIRAVFSIAWVAAAFTVAQSSAFVAAVLLVVYPAWDAAANYLDASRSGGVADNHTQAINIMVSAATVVAVVAALQIDMNWVLGVFGIWAILAGLLQLATALRRWKRHGAQWAMVLSGAQSALAGGFFIRQALLPAVPNIGNIAGYAAVGALYFLISAVWLVVAGHRRGGRQAA
ncbi:DUF308 domain-containing protein [Bordetella genomosp. 11]|uniref:DUF308 domain-containing protein n=1 Tax=Bordetella genomosp. 11 TaxID=1416808 RepID=A0A261V0T8_9BORD|nr:DUF308 domain-containing protein [Bordetella genomosp. 11]OZI66773.1 hypothetical protein CAL28_03350 [Bordetella genomosp. 11]